METWSTCNGKVMGGVERTVVDPEPASAGAHLLALELDGVREVEVQRDLVRSGSGDLGFWYCNAKETAQPLSISYEVQRGNCSGEQARWRRPEQQKDINLKALTVLRREVRHCHSRRSILGKLLSECRGAGDLLIGEKLRG